MPGVPLPHLACLDVPALPLQLLLRRHPDWAAHPAAVVDRDKAQGTILWVNSHAHRLRILPGMRYAAAQALARELRAGVVDEDAITRATAQLTDRLRFFTPDVEPATGDAMRGIFWLGVGGLSLLHPSLERWAHALREDLAANGWLGSVAVGFTRFGTYALARACPRVLVLDDVQQEAALARDIPLDRLGLDPAVRDALRQLGVVTLGGFLDLPADGVLERFGLAAHQMHRLAADELWAPLQPLPAHEPVGATVRLDHPERDRQRLLHLIEAILQEQLAVLAQRHRLLRELTLHLLLEDPPPDGDRTRTERLRPAHPTLQPRPVLELVALRLEALEQARALGSGVLQVHLQLDDVPPARDQMELFPQHPQRDPRAASTALARVRALFGDGSVVRAKLADGHLPEARGVWEVWGDAPLPAQIHARTVLQRPLVRRMFERPIPLSSQRRNEPDGWMILGLEGGPVREVLGPYRISGGWWVREVQREYHYVRTDRTGWLWVYFDRRRRRWFAQGVVE